MASSRDKDQAPPHHHQPLLSSLVVRPSHTEVTAAAGGGGRAADYEPGELRRDPPPPPPYSRSDRYTDDPGLFLFPHSLFYLRLSLDQVFEIICFVISMKKLAWFVFCALLICCNLANIRCHVMIERYKLLDVTVLFGFLFVCLLLLLLLFSNTRL